MTPQHAGSESLVTVDQMRARLAELDAAVPERPATVPDTVAPARWRLRERVVLLDYFAAGALESRTGPTDSSSPQVQEFIARDCEVVTTRLGGAWRLRLGVRHDTLSRLDVRGALAAATASDSVAAGPEDVTHRMARRLLGGERDLERLSPTELSGILRAREWLQGLGLDLPAEVDVRRALDLANVLAPLRAVARSDFVGREAELARLEAFVATPGAAPEPLAIHGPGGVGKSALVAKFVLDHVEGRTERLAFAYLTFDRAELDPQYPLTLVREMCRQVALQSPKQVQWVAGLVRDIDSQLAADVALRRELSSSRGTSTRDVQRSSADEGHYLSQLAKLIQSAGGKPFLLVLDTFEVAQRRRRSSLTILDGALRTLRGLLPSVRIVVAGRAEARELTSNLQPLGGLTATQAQHLLRRAIADLPVPDALVADVASRVSGNPLSLRLAADLMIREGADVLTTGRGRRRFLFGLRAEQVQGILYRRILDHVDTAIQPLANPGLVVRRITPEVISDVLAEPCGLGRLTPEQAMTLFDTLRVEVSLVTEVSPGVLVHRADVRQEMLPLLESDDPDRVTEIHHRAVTYYGARTGTDDRTEHLYHRLMLGESTATLDQYWDPVAGAPLEGSMPELPPSSRVYLAGKLPDAEADPADLAAADHASWVRQASRQARRLLDAGQSNRALDLLLSHPVPEVREDPVVSMLTIEAMASSGRRQEALALATTAIARADERGLGREYVELSILAGRVAEDDGDLVGAGRHYAEAREGARDLGVRTAALTAGAGVLRVIRRGGSGGRDAGSDPRRLRGELIAEVATLTEREKARSPGLLRELAAELGDAVPSLLADAAAHLGVETEGTGAHAMSDHDRDTINRAVSGPRDSTARRDIFEAEPGSDVTSDLSSAVKGRAVAEALKRAPDDLDLVQSVKQYWESEADRPSFDYYDDQGK